MSLRAIESDGECCGALVLSRPAYFCFSLLILVAGWVLLESPEHASARPGGEASDPNAVCASCHREIYERYRRTPMANASGLATEGFIPADFEHNASGVHYRVTEESGRVWLNYAGETGERKAAEDRALNGRQELRYFIGSGKRGRTYLFEQQGYWFESPINWYAKKQVWDMAPNHLGDSEMPLTMPVDPGCLHCHASGVAQSLQDARNHYASEPVADGGITCADCHGDTSAHVASGGKAHMMKIDALDPVRRDSICLNCHLEGQAAVVREGRERESFTPGRNLFDYTLFFVYKSESGSGGRATSQWEALLRSECKRKSGERLTCTSCHDPHGSPAAGEKVAFYRAKCLQCHEQRGFAEKHHPENPDCTECHMARPPSNDIAHEQVTDHWIKKRITNSRQPLATSEELEDVGGFAANDRDLGLAYAQMAARRNQDAGVQAMELLHHAEQMAGGAHGDHELHSELGFLEQLNVQADKAAVEYRLALQADPFDSLAAGDLALIEARRHHFQEAAQLWRSVFEWEPGMSKAGMTLAVVECAEGYAGAALRTLERLLEFAPDDEKARAFANKLRWDEGRAGKMRCGTR